MFGVEAGEILYDLSPRCLARRALTVRAMAGFDLLRHEIEMKGG
jgi:hypothetical protein